MPVLHADSAAWEPAVSLLGRDDLMRFNAARDRPRRGAFLTGRTELRRLGARWLGVPAPEVTVAARCPHCSSTAHGRPAVSAPDGRALHASIARTDAYVLVAVSPDDPLGADLERRDGASFDGFDHAALATPERLHVSAADPGRRDWLRSRLWAAKEAVLKTSGLGLTTDPRDVIVTDPAAHRTTATDHGRDAPSRQYVVEYLNAPVGYTAAVGLPDSSRNRTCTP